MSTVNHSDIRGLPERKAPAGTHDSDSSGAASIFCRAWGWASPPAVHKGTSRILHAASSPLTSELSPRNSRGIQPCSTYTMEAGKCWDMLHTKPASSRATAVATLGNGLFRPTIR